MTVFCIIIFGLAGKYFVFNMQIEVFLCKALEVEKARQSEKQPDKERKGRII